MQAYKQEPKLHRHNDLYTPSKGLKVFHIHVFDKPYYGSYIATEVGSPDHKKFIKSPSYKGKGRYYIVASTPEEAATLAINRQYYEGLSQNVLGRIAQKYSKQDLWCYEELLIQKAKTSKK